MKKTQARAANEAELERNPRHVKQIVNAIADGMPALPRKDAMLALEARTPGCCDASRGSVARQSTTIATTSCAYSRKVARVADVPMAVRLIAIVLFSWISATRFTNPLAIRKAM